MATFRLFFRPYTGISTTASHASSTSTDTPNSSWPKIKARGRGGGVSNKPTDRSVVSQAHTTNPSRRNADTVSSVDGARSTRTRSAQPMAARSTDGDGGAGVVNALNGGVLCYGTGDMDRPVALVQVDIAALKKWADGAGVAYKSAEALCESKEAEKYVLDELNKVGKSGKLGANEVLAGVSLIAGTGEPTRGVDVAPQFHDPWTPQNGALTATNKINRKPIEKFFAKQVKALAAKGIR